MVSKADCTAERTLLPAPRRAAAEGRPYVKRPTPKNRRRSPPRLPASFGVTPRRSPCNAWKGANSRPKRGRPAPFSFRVLPPGVQPWFPDAYAHG